MVPVFHICNFDIGHTNTQMQIQNQENKRKERDTIAPPIFWDRGVYDYDNSVVVVVDVLVDDDDDDDDDDVDDDDEAEV